MPDSRFQIADQIAALASFILFWLVLSAAGAAESPGFCDARRIA
jgi:hypothetical protein